eukprot:5951111-Pyramimonas_sp.AAC.2
MPAATNSKHRKRSREWVADVRDVRDFWSVRCPSHWDGCVMPWSGDKCTSSIKRALRPNAFSYPCPAKEAEKEDEAPEAEEVTAKSKTGAKGAAKKSAAKAKTTKSKKRGRV